MQLEWRREHRSGAAHHGVSRGGSASLAAPSAPSDPPGARCALVRSHCGGRAPIVHTRPLFSFSCEQEKQLGPHTARDTGPVSALVRDCALCGAPGPVIPGLARSDEGMPLAGHTSSPSLPRSPSVLQGIAGPGQANAGLGESARTIAVLDALIAHALALPVALLLPPPAARHPSLNGLRQAGTVDADVLRTFRRGVAIGVIHALCRRAFASLVAVPAWARAPRRHALASLIADPSWARRPWLGRVLGRHPGAGVDGAGIAIVRELVRGDPLPSAAAIADRPLAIARHRLDLGPLRQQRRAAPAVDARRDLAWIRRSRAIRRHSAAPPGIRVRGTSAAAPPVAEVAFLDLASGHRRAEPGHRGNQEELERTSGAATITAPLSIYRDIRWRHGSL